MRVKLLKKLLRLRESFRFLKDETHYPLTEEGAQKAPSFRKTPFSING